MNCGTVTTLQDIQLLKKNKALSLNLNRRNMETIWIPVQFHLVGTNDGNGRISPQKVLDGLCKLNSDFANTNMQFYLSGSLNELDNTAMYDMEFPPIPPGVNTQFAIKRVQGAVNIYIGNGLTSGNSGFYTSGTDVIYMDKRYVNSDDVILAHELGHFLGLPHTFLGWEETTYDPDTITPTEVFRGDRAFNVEYVDRSINCEDSGDFFCGTPADYILDWNGGCNYTGGAVDPDSVLLDPDETNFMAYYSFANCQQYIFAEDQTMAMLSNLMNRGEFSGTSIEPMPAVTGGTELILPEDGQAVNYENVVLDWSPVEHASHYLVEVSRLQNFQAIEAQVVTTENTFTISELSVDKKFYWRVKSFNATNSCDLLESEIRVFNTQEMASSTTQLDPVQELTVSPNPIFTDSPLTLFSNIDIGLTSVEMYNSDGRLLSTSSVYVRKGSNAVDNPTTIAPGYYFIKLKSGSVTQTIKFLKI